MVFVIFRIALSSGVITLWKTRPLNSSLSAGWKCTKL